MLKQPLQRFGSVAAGAEAGQQQQQGQQQGTAGSSRGSGQHQGQQQQGQQQQGQQEPQESDEAAASVYIKIEIHSVLCRSFRRLERDNCRLGVMQNSWAIREAKRSDDLLIEFN